MAGPDGHREIERRFLCRADPGMLESGDRQEIRQAYLTDGEPSVRVRAIDDHWVLTVKAGSGLVRREVEAPLPPEAGEAMLELATSAILVKTRHLVGRWEVDVYGGELGGLVIAECELSAPDEPLPEPPGGLELLREVTELLTAQRLARMAPADARRLVERLRARG